MNGIKHDNIILGLTMEERHVSLSFDLDDKWGISQSNFSWFE